MIDIRELPKHEVLMALWENAAKRKTDKTEHAPLTLEQAQAVVQEKTYRDKGDTRDHLFVDTLNGREMHVEIGADNFEEWNYDRYSGKGAAQKAIDALRARKQEEEST